jgi:ATP-dependent DNA ligase
MTMVCRASIASVFRYAFDLIELNGDDLRRDPLGARTAMLAHVLANARHGIDPHRGRWADRVRPRL